MRRIVTAAALAGILSLGSGTEALAQEVENDFLEVGAMAPDVEMAGATKHGVLAESIKLSDSRGETVVLAFFFRARTRG